MWAGRLLLLGIAVVLAASPWTECVWTWDGFPRGGQDMELGVVAFAAMLCLAIVLFQQARSQVASLLSYRVLPSGARERTAYASASHTGRVRLASPPVPACSIPLQI